MHYEVLYNIQTNTPILHYSSIYSMVWCVCICIMFIRLLFIYILSYHTYHKSNKYNSNAGLEVW